MCNLTNTDSPEKTMQRKSQRTKQILFAPRHVDRVVQDELKKLVWVTVGKTEHQARLLEEMGEGYYVLIRWESTGREERVPVLSVRHESYTGRRSRRASKNFVQQANHSIKQERKKNKTEKKIILPQTLTKISTEKTLRTSSVKRRLEKVNRCTTETETNEITTNISKEARPTLWPSVGPSVDPISIPTSSPTKRQKLSHPTSPMPTIGPTSFASIYPPVNNDAAKPAFENEESSNRQVVSKQLVKCFKSNSKPSNMRSARTLGSVSRIQKRKLVLVGTSKSLMRSKTALRDNVH